MKRVLITAAILMVTAAVVWLSPPENLALGRGVLQAVPTTFGDWSGTDYSFEDAVVEELKASDLAQAQHPYTQGLYKCLPRIEGGARPLPTLQRDAGWAV